MKAVNEKRTKKKILVFFLLVLENVIELLMRSDLHRKKKKSFQIFLMRETPIFV